MSLASDLRRIRDRRNGDIERVAQDALSVLGTRIVIGTPVRDGAAKGNWLASYGAADTSARPDEVDKTGQKSIQRLELSLNGLQVGTEFFFTNSLVYMPRLENGWSLQAPAGMVKTNVADWQNIARRSVNRYK